MDAPSAITLWAAVPAGLAIGAWAGFSATSGWIVVFPMLFVVAERPLFECLLAALVVDWANAVAASPFYLQRGDPDLRIALRWLGVSAPLVLVGVGIALVVLPRLETVLGGASGPIAIAMGFVLLRRAWRSPDHAAEQQIAHGESIAEQRIVHGETTAEQRIVHGESTGVAALHGTALLRVGLSANAVLMGILGQSGGLNTALLLILLRRAPTRMAVATALVLAALVLPVGIGAYLVVVGSAPGLWPAVLPFATASALASGLAAWQSARIPERRLEFVVAGCVLLAGVAASLERWALVG